MKPFIQKALLTALAASGLIAAQPVTQALAASYDVEWDNYAQVSTSGYTGVSAQMMRQNDAIVSSTDQYSRSSAWIMCDNNVSNGPYAQVGWEDDQNRGVYYFFEAYDTVVLVQELSNGQDFYTTSGAVGPARGSYHTYKVWENSNQSWNASVDGAFSNYWYFYPNMPWSSTRIEVSEELHDKATTEFYGTSSSPTYIYNVQATNSSGVTGNVNLTYTTGTGNDSTINGHSITNNGTSQVTVTLWDLRAY